MRNILMWAMVFAAAPAAAQTIEAMPRPAADFAAFSTDQLVAQLQTATDDAAVCTTTYPILTELAKRRPDVAAIRDRTAFAAMICAVQRSDYPAAYRYLRETPTVSSLINPLYVLFLTSDQGDAPAILAELRTVLTDSTDETAAALDIEIFMLASRRANELDATGQVERLALETLKAGRLPKFESVVRQALAYRALGAAADAGDSAAARIALAELSDPNVFVTLLGHKRFAPLRPAIEARVGPNYITVTADHRSRALARLEAAPKDLDTLSEAAYAHYYDGRFAEVIALADKATSRDDLAGTMAEEEGWVLNLKAYSLDALGRAADADAVFDMLAMAAERQPQWGVSFVINRALRLVGQERWNEGLAAAARAQAVANTNGNSYAKALVAESQVCALSGLGRGGEAAPYLATLRKEAAAFPLRLAAGLQCLGRADEAADLLVTALQDEKTRATVLDDLQAEAFDMFYTRSELPQPRDLMATHPRLRDAFQVHARIIPETYWPAASLKR